MSLINWKKLWSINAWAVTSFVSAISLSACGSSNNTVRVAIPYAVDDHRYQLFAQLVKQYNSDLKKHHFDQKNQSYQDGYLPVVMYSTSDYGTSASTIDNQLSSKDPYTPNLSLGYGNTVFSANINGHRALNFSVSTATDYPNNKNHQLYQNDQISRSSYQATFTHSNDLISGLNEGGFYLIPMGASTELMYWSKPVLHYLISQAIEKKLVSIKNDEHTWFQEHLGISSFGDNKLNKSTLRSETTSVLPANSQVTTTYTVEPTLADKIKKYYGEVIETPKENTPVAISTATFQSFEGLFGFLKLVLSHLKNPQPLVAFVQSNLLEFATFVHQNANFDKYMIHKDKTKNLYDYSFFKNKNSTETQALKTVYDLIHNSVANNGVFNPTTGRPEVEFKQGKLAFMLNSNSKYSKLFDKNNSSNLSQKDVLVTNEPFYYQKLTNDGNNTTAKGGFWVQGGSLLGIKANAQKDHATRLFVKWLTSKESQLTFNNRTYNGSDWYALSAGYVPGSSDFWKKGEAENLKLLENINKGAAAALEVFASTLKNNVSTGGTVSTSSNGQYTWGFKKQTNLAPFSEPVGALSNEFRKAADANGKGASTFPTFDQFWANLTSTGPINTYIANSK